MQDETQQHIPGQEKTGVEAQAGTGADEGTADGAAQAGQEKKARKETLPRPALNLLSVDKMAEGRPLSSYDLMKVVAFGLILIDLIAVYVLGGVGTASGGLPGEGIGQSAGAWLHCFGLMGVPVLCFLIGYDGNRNMSIGWLVAGIVVSGLGKVFHLPVFPLDMIVTLVACSALTLTFAEFLERNRMYFWYIILLVLFLGPVSSFFIAYGTSALLFSLWGFAQRNTRVMENVFKPGIAQNLMIVAFIGHGVVNMWAYGFSVLQLVVFLVFSGLVMAYLRSFKALYSARLTQNNFAGVVQFVSLHVLYLYVILSLALKTLNAGFSAIGSLLRG